MANNYAYLVMVDAVQNNNKFYEIIENSDRSIDVKYGRVGVSEMKKHYNSGERYFDTLLREKMNKGYTNVTSLHSVKETPNGTITFKNDKNSDIQAFLDTIVNSSREFMAKNYTVKPSEITQKMIDEADADIAELHKIAENPRAYTNSLYEFNSVLQRLFVDVPRKMRDVSAYCATIESDFDKILTREIEMLDNVRGAVVQAEHKENPVEHTIADAYNLEIRPVTYKEEDQITTHLGKDYSGNNVENRYIKAFAVENKATRKSYENYKEKNNISPKDVKLFYHGSKVENWFSIIKTGLLLNPNASITGKMFGQGLYFAPECRKALNYMDTKGSHWNNGSRDTGYCAVYAVALGKSYEPSYVLGSSFKEKDLPSGTQSVFASKHNPRLGLKNDEYIVYNQSACTIKYIMEMSAFGARGKSYNLNRSVLRDNLSDGFGIARKIADGIEIEFNPEKLNQDVQNEISQKIAKGFDDLEKIYVRYYIKSDRIEFEGEKSDGDLIEFYPDITKDDYAFFAREMKKTFAESEPEWKEKISVIKNYPLGKVINFSTVENGKSKKTQIKQEGRE